MRYLGEDGTRHSLVECSCQITLRVPASQYRVECVCGQSAVLRTLKKEADDAFEKPKESVCD